MLYQSERSIEIQEDMGLYMEPFEYPFDGLLMYIEEEDGSFVFLQIPVPVSILEH